MSDDEFTRILLAIARASLLGASDDELDSGQFAIDDLICETPQYDPATVADAFATVARFIRGEKRE